MEGKGRIILKKIARILILENIRSQGSQGLTGTIKNLSRHSRKGDKGRQFPPLVKGPFLLYSRERLKERGKSMFQEIVTLTDEDVLELPENIMQILKINEMAGVAIYLEEKQIVLKPVPVKEKIVGMNSRNIGKPSYRFR